MCGKQLTSYRLLYTVRGRHQTRIRDIVEAAGMVKDNYRKKMDACLWYMQSINLPKEMKDRVRQWFLYNWNQQKTIDERSLVVSLPKKLQTDLAINVHFNTLSKVQLFQDCERNLLYDLVLKLKPILYLPGDYICQKGEVGKEMYIVTQGQVEVVGGENNNTVLATLHEGSVFGEISLLAMSGRGNRRTADVRSKGYTNVFTLSKHDFEMAMTEYPDAQAVLKKRAKKLLKANAKMEKKHKKVEAEEIIKTSPETPKLLQTVIQIMDPDSNVVKQLTPNVRSRSPRSFNRPHSRSHSHRLSPTTANVHHLTPPRSHSYRLANKTSCEIHTPVMGHNRTIISQDKDGYDTDEENDEPMMVESSDDVSLSEVLHDAGANSSFEDDGDNEDDDDILMNEDYQKNWNRQSSPIDAWDVKKSASHDQSTEGDRNADRSSPRCYKEQPELVTVENINQSDYHSSERRDSQRSWKEQENKAEDNEENNSREKRADQTVIDNNGNEEGSSRLKGPNGHIVSVRCNMLKAEDSMEDYVEKQRWTANVGNMGNNVNSENNGNSVFVTEVHKNGQKLNVSTRMEKLAPPPLVMPAGSSSMDIPENGGGRHRKLSVVTPPVSPASPRDKPANQNWGKNFSPRSPASPLEKTNSHWAYSPHSPVSPRDKSPGAAWSKTVNLHSPVSPQDKMRSNWSTQTQVIGRKDEIFGRNSSSMSNETIPIMPLPPVDTVLVKNTRLPENPHHIGVKGSVLTNGLEGCCGSGPLVDIPAENRITCSVEIHRQKSISSSTTDIHGHTETML
ncbi:cyclic nucleotide gated channel beta 1 [Bulinus truncatus]|nr:cyclic nucleotide gated channel beta 1 [Bulinus truncatus]